MLCFPNAKINVGLNIVSKRSDGFHNLETIFYPIDLCDALEFIETDKTDTSLATFGIGLDADSSQNICIKAYDLLHKNHSLPPLEVFLHKFIPVGAGLGGGSSDAAFMLRNLNIFYKLGLSVKELLEYASSLGSDCPFFIENKPVFAHGRGELFEEIQLDLSGYFIYLIKPNVFISTPEAYKRVHPKIPEKPLYELIKEPIEHWKDLIVNDFEKSIFGDYPELERIKNELYQSGAVYASMSGSGSAMYGIYKDKPLELLNYKDYFNWISPLH